jgi:hypothetical protein
MPILLYVTYPTTEIPHIDSVSISEGLAGASEALDLVDEDL